MHLRKVVAKNIYSFNDLSLTFANDYSLLIGPNNVGKSNVFRLIDLLLNELSPQGTTMTESLQFSDKSIPSMTLGLTLSIEEVHAFVSFINYLVSAQKFPDKDKLIFGNNMTKTNFLDDIVIKLTWDRINFPLKTLTASISLIFSKIGLEIKRNSTGSWDFIVNDVSYQMSFELFECMEKYTTKKQFVQNIKKFCKEGYHKVDFGQSIGIPSTSEGDQRNVLSIIGRYFEPDGSLSFLKFMARLIRDGIFQISNNRNINSHEELGYPAKLESDASNITRFLYALNISPIIEERTRFRSIQSKFKDLFNGKMSFEIVANYSLESEKARGSTDKREHVSASIVIFDHTLNKQFFIDQVGTGIREVLFLLTVIIGTSQMVLLLDEPAINLHFLLLKKIINMILNENTVPRNQFILISHSSNVAHHMFLDSHAAIYYFNKKNNSTRITFMNPTPKSTIHELKRKLVYMINSEIFFANIVILTEGQSDKIVLDMAADYFSKFDKDFDLEANGILLVDGNSVDSFPNYSEILNRLKIKHALIGDYNALTKGGRTGNIFKNPSRITTKGIIRKNKKVFIIDKIGSGNIEDLMDSLSHFDFNAAKLSVFKKYPKGNKPLLAYEFMQRVIKNNPACLKVIQELLALIIK